MSKTPNQVKYLASLADELCSQASRVRDLIGDSHWLTDGHHKEYLLLNLLKRHLPTSVIAGRGFVISSASEDICSREQDILIVDAFEEAPVFHQSNVIISFPKQVIAAISVKTQMTKESVVDTANGLFSVRETCAGERPGADVWLGGFFFEQGSTVKRNPSLVYKYLDQIAVSLGGDESKLELLSCPSMPDALASGDELYFVKEYSARNGGSGEQFLGYQCGTLAAAMFIANLLEHVAVHRGAANGVFSDFADVVECSLLPHADDSKNVSSE